MIVEKVYCKLKIIGMAILIVAIPFSLSASNLTCQQLFNSLDTQKAPVSIAVTTKLFNSVFPFLKKAKSLNQEIIEKEKLSYLGLLERSQVIEKPSSNEQKIALLEALEQHHGLDPKVPHLVLEKKNALLSLLKKWNNIIL